MGARHPRFFEINRGAPTSAPMIFWDLFKRGTHDLEIQRGPCYLKNPVIFRFWESQISFYLPSSIAMPGGHPPQSWEGLHFSQGEPHAKPIVEQQHSLLRVKPKRLFSHWSVKVLMALQHVPLLLSMQTCPVKMEKSHFWISDQNFYKIVESVIWIQFK